MLKRLFHLHSERQIRIMKLNKLKEEDNKDHQEDQEIEVVSEEVDLEEEEVKEDLKNKLQNHKLKYQHNDKLQYTYIKKNKINLTFFFINTLIFLLKQFFVQKLLIATYKTKFKNPTKSY